MTEKQASESRNSANSIKSSTIAEAQLLGALLVGPRYLAEVQAILKLEDFEIPKHQHVYSAMLAEQGVDLKGEDWAVAVWHRVELDGHAPPVTSQWIGDLGQGARLVGEVSQLAHRIRRASAMRHLSSSASKIVEQIGLADDMNDEDLAKWAGYLIREITGNVGGADVKRLVERLEEFNVSGFITKGADDLRTGLLDIDRECRFFEPGALVVIGARPGMGKSTFLRRLVRENASRAETLVFTFEESYETFRAKLICEESGVSFTKYLRGMMGETDLALMAAGMGRIAELKCSVLDRSMSADEIAAQCRRHGFLKAKPRIIYIDHLQHMKIDRARNENDAAAFARAALTFANLAREMDATVVLLAQLNRRVEERDEPRPYLSDLRDTGALEQLAHVVLFLWSKEVMDPTRFAYIAKQRTGTPFERKLHFRGEYGRFDNHSDATNADQ